MTTKFELYKCDICGNLIEVLISGEGHPVCCGAEMERIEAQNDNINSAALTEKHSPEVTTENGQTKITVLKHPTEEAHHIMFVQAVSADKTKSEIQFYKPHEEVIMESNINPENIYTRSYCNIHGLYVN